MPGTGETEETYNGSVESEVADNYSLDTLATEDGYVVDVEVDNVLDLLDDSVKNITAKLAGLSGEDFATLRAGEEAGKTRKSLVKAFDEEANRRTESA
jgi:hypothetical protein